MLASWWPGRSRTAPCARVMATPDERISFMIWTSSIGNLRFAPSTSLRLYAKKMRNFSATSAPPRWKPNCYVTLLRSFVLVL